MSRQKYSNSSKNSKSIQITQNYLKTLTEHAQLGRPKDNKTQTEQTQRQLQEARNRKALMSHQREQQQNERLKKQYDQEVRNVHRDQLQSTHANARRNQVLDMAYKRLYEDTDRVKHFKSAMKQAEMMQEREEQETERTRQAQEKSEYDRRFMMAMMRDMEEMGEKEGNDKLKVVERKKENAKNWTEQIEKNKAKKESEKWEHLREGFLLRDSAQNEDEKAAAKEKQIKNKQLAYKADLDRQLENQRKLFDIHQELLEKEDLKAKIFNDAKREMLKTHKKLKEEAQQDKESSKKLVINSLTDSNESRKAKEEAAQRKAIREAEEKTRTENAIKAADRAEAQEAIKQFYEDTLASRHRKQFEDKLKSYQEQRDILDKMDELRKVEEEKESKRLELEKESMHVQLHQIAEHKKKLNDKKLQDIKDYLNHMKGLDEEEDVFQKYAEMEIEKAEARGIDTRAMRKAARRGIEVGNGPLFKDRGQIRPRYYAATKVGQDLTHTERESEEVETKYRLGFMAY